MPDFLNPWRYLWSETFDGYGKMDNSVFIQIFQGFTQVHAAIGDALLQTQMIADLAEYIYTGNAGDSICDRVQDDISITVAF